MKSISALDQIIQRGGNGAEQWEILCSSISSSNYELSEFIQNISSKLQNFGAANILLLLDVIDYCIDRGNENVWEKFASKTFLSILINILKSNKIQEIQFKILSLFKKWGLKFKNESSTLSNFHNIYSSLLSSGVRFPEKYTSTYEKYFYPPKGMGYNQSQSQMRNYDEDELDYSESLKVSLVPSNYEGKYNKLVKYLINTVENIALSNEMIDNSKQGNLDDILKEIINELRHANNKLIETIGSERLKNEKLMEITLGITDDINRTINRFDNIRSGGKAEPFLSYFVEKNARGDRLIPMEKRRPKKNNNSDSNINNNNNNNNNNSNSNRMNFDNINNQQNVPEIKADPNINSVDDIFEIFSKPKPTNNINQNFNPNQNIVGGFNSNFNSEQIQQQRMGQPQIQPQEKSRTALLQEKLQMIYQQNNQNPMGMGGNQGFDNMGMSNQNPMMRENMSNMSNPMLYPQNSLNPPMMESNQNNIQYQFPQEMMNNTPMNINNNNNKNMMNYPNFDINQNDEPMNNMMGNMNYNPQPNSGFQGNNSNQERLEAINSLF